MQNILKNRTSRGLGVFIIDCIVRRIKALIKADYVFVKPIAIKDYNNNGVHCYSISQLLN